MFKLDLLAFGAHPDDVELGVGGILATAAQAGYGVGIADVTGGEMGSYGNKAERAREAQQAASIINAWRINLHIPDRSIIINRKNLDQVVTLIRTTKPALILAPYAMDRHPDHIITSQLVEQACFDSGLKKVCSQLPCYRPKVLAFYCLNQGVTPSVIIDVSACYAVKQAAIAAHQTQFGQQGTSHIKELIVSRDRYYGAMLGVEYGEGLILKGPLPLKDVSMLWSG